MSKLKFKYDIDKDMEVYERAFVEIKYPTYGREMNITSSVWDIQKNNDKTEPVAEQLTFIRGELEKFIQKNQIFISDYSKYIQREWDKIETRYIEGLEEYFKLNVDYDMTAYITTVDIGPYNPRGKYFFAIFSRSAARQLTGVAHEMMHIVFRSQYDDLLTERGMNRQDILEINEAMTTLINLRFSELFILPDFNNKPTAKDLRDKIKEIYREDLDFSVILDELIKMRKK